MQPVQYHYFPAGVSWTHQTRRSTVLTTTVQPTRNAACLPLHQQCPYNNPDHRRQNTSSTSPECQDSCEQGGHHASRRGALRLTQFGAHGNGPASLCRNSSYGTRRLDLQEDLQGSARHHQARLETGSARSHLGLYALYCRMPVAAYNRALGLAAGNEQMTNVLSQNASKLRKLTQSFGGYFAWEWLDRCDLLKDPRVQES